ncbi:MAG TPA: hypothetical protein VF196_01165 [Casimicrobiaceae bacterium]
MDRCVTCQFYDRQNRGGEKSANAGQCRREAPSLSPINQKSYMIEGVWPTVRDDDWCGEWKALVRRVDPARIADVLNGSPVPPGAPRLAEMPPPRRPLHDPLPAPQPFAAIGRGDD